MCEVRDILLFRTFAFYRSLSGAEGSGVEGLFLPDFIQPELLIILYDLAGEALDGCHVTVL